MNTYTKMVDGTWGVACPDTCKTGETVTVTTKAGKEKQVTLGECVGTYTAKRIAIFAIVDAPRETVTVGDMSGVLALFAKAQKHLKYPAIVLSVPAADVTVRLSVAGPRARVPGSITVLDANKGDDGRDWFGRITTDGAFQPSDRLNGKGPAVADRLREFACDPVKVAADHGRLTGACCFCNLPLTDARSTAAGYGQTCARNYGLAWGRK